MSRVSYRNYFLFELINIKNKQRIEIMRKDIRITLVLVVNNI